MSLTKTLPRPLPLSSRSIDPVDFPTTDPSNPTLAGNARSRIGGTLSDAAFHGRGVCILRAGIHALGNRGAGGSHHRAKHRTRPAPVFSERVGRHERVVSPAGLAVAGRFSLCALRSPAGERSLLAQPGRPATVPEVAATLGGGRCIWMRNRSRSTAPGFGGWVALAAMLADAKSKRFRGAVLQGAYRPAELQTFGTIAVGGGQKIKPDAKDVPGWRTVFAQNHRHWFPPFDATAGCIFQQIAGRVPVRNVAERIAPLAEGADFILGSRRSRCRCCV